MHYTWLIFAFAVSTSAFAQNSSYHCFISAKDGAVEELWVEADSVKAAKGAAEQNLGKRAVKNTASCQLEDTKPATNPNTKSSANPSDEIPKLNPQLRQIPDWIKTVENTSIQNCDRCLNPEYASIAGAATYRCVFVSGKLAGQAWETGGGDTGEFQLVLHPGTPKVWRVFLHGHRGEKTALIAQFDPQGELVWSRSARSRVYESFVDKTNRRPDKVPASECKTTLFMAAREEPPPYRGISSTPMAAQGAAPTSQQPESPSSTPGSKPVDEVAKKAGDLLKKILKP